MKKIYLLSFVTANLLMGSGYKIPESSTNAVGLSAANIAHNHENADAAYYNPAKMVFMEDHRRFEGDLMFIHLDKVVFDGHVDSNGPYMLEAQKENFLVPATHFVSGKLTESGLRAGLSVVVPGGLTKRWDEEPASAEAKQFTLEIIEVNPTLAFPIGQSLGVAIGARAVYSSGIVKADGFHDAGLLGIDGLAGADVVMDMEGSSFDFGYNVALAFQPISRLEIAATYRSKIDLTVEGDAKVTARSSALDTLPLPMNEDYDAGASITAPLPATLSLAVAYTFPSETTFEFVYEKSYWSAFKKLDFNFAAPTGTATEVIDQPVPKNWQDTKTYRFGMTQKFEDMTMMAGFVKDQTAIPNETLGFELPGTDTYALSLGMRVAYNEQIDIGLSGVYSVHEERTVSNDHIDGEFTKGNVFVLSAGIGYTF